MKKLLMFLFCMIYTLPCFAQGFANGNGYDNGNGNGNGNGGSDSLSSKVIYASKAGCVLNSNVLTGGGTDDTVCLQTQLDTLAAAGGGELVIDGAALISNTNVKATVSDPIVAGDQTTCLMVGSGTTIRVINNGGVYLASNSSCTMLGNLITGDPAATPQKNIKIIGGTWNGNDAGQPRSAGLAVEKGVAGNIWISGFWFGGFDGLVVRDLTILDSGDYSLYLTQGTNFVVDNVIVKSTVQNPAGSGHHHDGYHMDGTMSYGLFHNVQVINGDDDAIAFNTDEGYHWYLTYAGKYGVGRMPKTVATGAQSNITFDGVYLDAEKSIRMYAQGSGAIATLDNIYLHNIYGPIASGTNQTNNFVTFGNILIDGWYLTGYSGILLGNHNNLDTSQKITIRNVIFSNYDNSLGEPIIIYGPGQTAINGVIADAEVNPATANSLLYSSSTKNIAISNVVATNFQYIAHGTGAANIVLSNINQLSGTAIIDPAWAINSSTGDAVGNLSWQHISGINYQTTSTDSVGIGTNAPTGKLSVSGGYQSGIGTASTFATGINVPTGQDVQSNGIRINYNLSVYASGTAYSLTNSDAAMAFGTTSPTLTIDKPGTYLISGRAYLKYNAATYAGTQTATIHLQRTNNTAATIPNATTTATLRIVTTITDTVGIMPLPPVIYTTSNSNDVISLYGSLSAAPAAGSVDVVEASINAVRLY